jgi:hypothetical protein
MPASGTAGSVAAVRRQWLPRAPNLHPPEDAFGPTSVPVVEHVFADLGQLSGGTVVEIHLKGSAANVWLMDSSTYSRYKSGNQVRAIGGHTDRTPVHLRTNRSARWYAVADLGGYPGRLGLSARVLPGPATPLRQRPHLPADSPLVTFADELPDEAFEEREFDVFISHATEDKDQIVRPLARALDSRGIGVWFDEFELRVGDSLRQSIDRGIARSRFGLVVLSRSFFAKNWPQYELDGIVALDVHEGGGRLLPIWHEITKAELLKESPSLADRVALSTATLTIDEIASQLAEVIHPSGS